MAEVVLRELVSPLPDIRVMLLSLRPLILLCLAVACVSRDEPARDTARDAATTPPQAPGPAGHSLAGAAAPASTHLMVFETVGRAVVNYRAGRRPAVELVEGCS